jgi:hypothetical protein
MFTCMNGEWRSTAQYVPDKSVNPITQRFRDLLNILRIQVVVSHVKMTESGMKSLRLYLH